MSGKFEEDLVVVAGGALGIGRATVEYFAKEGARVAVWDVDEQSGQALATGLGERVRFYAVDVSRESDVQKAADETVRTFGEARHLVNSAGIQGAYLPVTETSRAEWERVLGINLSGAFYCAKHLIPSIERNGKSGCVINVASVNSFHCQKQTAAYATSKAALLGLSRSIAVDYAPTIRCVPVCPGAVETPMLEKALRALDNYDALMENLRKMHLGNRIAVPSEVAALIGFLCSDEGSFISGYPVRIDSGLGIAIGGNE